MKKVFILLAVLLIVLPLSARSTLEFCPRGSLYIGDEVSFGVGADLIVNVKKQFGVRVNVAELVFGEVDGISINSLSTSSLNTCDILYYTDIGGLFSYVSFTFGYSNVVFDDAIAVGGGLGLEKYMGKGNYMFFEPGIIYMDMGGADDLVFRLPFGFKLGI